LYHRGRSGKNPAAQAALVKLAKHREAQGQLKAAVENLRLADQIPNEDRLAAYDIKSMLAVDLLLLGQREAALEILKKMQSEVGKLPQDQVSQRIRISALEKLGIAYLRSHALAEARDAFETALALAEKLSKEFPEKVLLFKNYLGRILFQEGQLKE